MEIQGLRDCRQSFPAVLPNEESRYVSKQLGLPRHFLASLSRPVTHCTSLTLVTVPITSRTAQERCYETVPWAWTWRIQFSSWAVASNLSTEPE